MSDSAPKATPPRRRRRYVPAVGPRLRKVLFAVFGLFALLGANSAYLLAVRWLGLATDKTYENWFYLNMFLLHLALGLLIVVPVLVFGIAHMRNTYDRRNRRAVRVGYALFGVAIVLLVSGIALTRIEGVVELRDPLGRSIAWWLHVLTPLVAGWLFVLHRLAGKKIRWKVGAAWAGVAAVFAIAVLVWQAQDPRKWNVEGNPEGERYFFPSLARTLDGEFIPARLLQNDAYCQECHADVHESWTRSVHKMSSFNNPPYLFSVRGTREMALERDGDVRASRFCAGCHDPVPFFSGRFNDPEFDDENDPTAHAGITCTVCHSITHVNSPRGNADYTIQAPVHYPFAFSERPTLAWLNRQLVKAKPDFHKKTFLKPLHRSTEFCGTCHKVHLPEELNDYKWLRGQNHYDTFLLSGVSGSGAQSFYYPQEAEENCNGCHMPLVASDDFGAQRFDGADEPSVHDHLFPSANTAIAVLTDHENADEIVEAHRAFLEGTLRVDLFGIRRGATLTGELEAPLRPEIPAVRPGESILLETVVRTLKLGHHFTQGTADSNQVWLEVTATTGDGRRIGVSGHRDDVGRVDPWSHFVNAYVLDKHGNRIDRRNAEDIFVALYDHQIPPGAANVVHYRLEVPTDAGDDVTVVARLLYRKFDTTYMQHVYGPEFVNDLPTIEIARDTAVLPVARAGRKTPEIAERHRTAPDIPEWQRWNDYGIGLLLKPGRGALRQAEAAFRRVESLGHGDGAVNLARVYLREGRIGVDAPEALARAATLDPPGAPWVRLWLSGEVNLQNGAFEDALRDFEQIVEGGFEEGVGRGFDFSKDYRVLNRIGAAEYRLALRERGDARREARETRLRRAEGRFLQALAIEPENLEAHYNLKQIYADLGDREAAAKHTELHATYKPDDNARDIAFANARRNDPAADHAAEAVVIYDLGRAGAFGREDVATAERRPSAPAASAAGGARP